MSSLFFFFSSRRRHTIFDCDWSSDVCSSDLSGCELPGHPDRSGEPEFERWLLEQGLAGSEERRVGKECRSRWSLYHYKKKPSNSIWSANSARCPSSTGPTSQTSLRR